jgi:hypothetical protein
VPNALNTITLSAGGQTFPAYDPPGNPKDFAGINCFRMSTGASRYGVGCFAMLRGDYETLVDQAGTNAQATLAMNGSPGPGVSLTVILSMAEPLVTGVGEASSENDLMKITVFDRRCQNFGPVKKSYNVMSQGFPQTSGGLPQCYTSTLNGGMSPPTPASPAWTWAQLLNDSSAFPTSQQPDDLPSWNPYNLIWDNVPLNRVSDDIAARLFYVVAFDHQNCTPGKNYGLNLFAPGNGFDENDDVFTSANQYIVGGGDADRNSTRLPGQIVVTFQGYNADDPTTDPFKQRSHEKNVTIQGGSTDIRIPLHIGEQVAIYSGGAWANQSTLDSIATDMAPRAAAFIAQDFSQYEFPGIWPFKPDGNYREVIWLSEPAPRGARTIIKSHNAKDWLPTDALRDPINLVSNQEVVGIGTTTATIGAGGTKYVWSFSDSNVKVEVGSNIFAGFYNSTIYTGQLDDESDDNLTLPMGLTSGASALLIVTEEDAAVVDGFGNAPAAKQRLMSGSYEFGAYIGMSGEGTPRPMILVRGGVGSMSSATTINPTLTSLTADTTVWTRALTGTPANIYVQTRTAYDSTGGAFYAFQRQHSYDARGLLYRIGPEEKIEIIGTTPGCSSGG